ncbi:hypothetical protein [Methylophaga sp.]|jgi:hypothetical protein|uniref:hypothetical protein n=1 Tax=Methylophaga sp. TaxID=2024840 RepID=UPI002720ACEA|nr:hypothetical protein [Methylophaga sp.]MDO8827731.1 hypothetical protein [Methylophaga sp.]
MRDRNFLPKVVLASLLLVTPHLHAATWEYKSTDDPMTDEPIYEAVILSDNQVDVSFNRKATLSVITRFHPRNGWNIEFTIDNDQISCLGSCSVTIRLDNEKATNHSIEKVFNVKGYVYRVRNNAEKVAEGMFRAKKILVELEIFEQGAQLFRFETNTFDYGLFPHKPGEKEKR